ncbi:MAG TPA: PAS domain-containing sensor histidine kinase, partial [Phototrophicaceae bacterium]|nr:PAS domain-containing sensor histidine kinase [Phototrophicaceae bacterium]
NFRHLFMNNPLSMWVYDLETLAFLDVNDAAVNRYGYSRAEFLSMRLTDIRPPEDIPRLLENIAQPRHDLQNSGLWRHQRKNGEILDVEIVSHKMLINGKNAVLVVAQDVTERVKMQHDLQQSHETLRALVNASPLAIFLIDKAGTIQMCNPAATLIFGFTEAEMLGFKPPFIPPEKWDEFDNLLNRVLAGESVTDLETYRTRKDGSTINVIISAGVVPEAPAMMSVVMDITERKQLEAEVLEKEKLRLALNKEVEMRNLRNRFMSMVSHEFRNPLGVIVSSSSMIERYYDRMNSESRREHFANVEGQVKRLTEMLDDILNILRMEALKPEFKAEPVDLIQLCMESVQEARLSRQHTPRQIDFTCGAAAIALHADTKLVRQAVDNLIANALKYSLPPHPVQVEVWQEGAEAGIRVKDYGIGIPPESLKHLFEAFYRASNVGDIQGTGLGLAIAKQAIELHDGRIEVESTVGGGSTFTIYLPVSHS